MLTGVVLGNGVATSPGGRQVPFALAKVIKSVPNLTELAAESRRWRMTVRRIAPQGRDVAKRAAFADDVMAASIENVRNGVGDVIAAQASTGQVLGIATYIVEPRVKEAYLGLLATAPEYVPGAGPASEQLRGIGTSIVAAVSRDILARGVETVFLHGLDEAAVRFWRGRGFVVCGLGNLLCIRGRAGIDRLRGTCEVKPGPDQGEYLSCGEPQRLVSVRLPASTPAGVRGT